MHRPALTIAVLLVSTAFGQGSQNPSNNQQSQTLNNSGSQKSQNPGNQNGGGQGGGTAPFESQMLAYASVDKIAADIIKQTCQALPETEKSNVVLYDQTAFGNLVAYNSYVQQALLVEAAYNGFALPPIPSLVTREHAPTAAVQEVASVIMQFAQSTNSQSGSSITIPDPAIIEKLAHDLQGTPCPGKKVTSYYPPYGFASTEEEQHKEIDGISQNIKDIVNAKNAAETRFEAGKFDANSRQAAELKTANDLYTAFLQSLYSVNQSTGTPQMSSVIQGYRLAKILQTKNTSVLVEQFYAAGGTVQDRKNVITSLTTGDWISYGGGAVIGFALIQGECNYAVNIQDKCDVFVLADVLRYRTPPTKIHKPTDVSNIQEGDNFDEKPPEKGNKQASKSAPNGQPEAKEAGTQPAKAPTVKDDNKIDLP